MCTRRKIAVLFLFYTDVVLHGVSILGWSSISEILRKEGFFLECRNELNESCAKTQSTEISYLFNLVVAIVGPIYLVYGLIQDHISYGCSRRVFSLNFLMKKKSFSRARNRVVVCFIGFIIP